MPAAEQGQPPSTAVGPQHLGSLLGIVGGVGGCCKASTLPEAGGTARLHHRI